MRKLFTRRNLIRAVALYIGLLSLLIAVYGQTTGEQVTFLVCAIIIFYQVLRPGSKL